MTSQRKAQTGDDSAAWRVNTDDQPTVAIPAEIPTGWLGDAVGSETEAQIVDALSLTFRSLGETTRVAREYLADPLGRELARASARIAHIQLLRLARILVPGAEMSREGKDA